MPALFLSRKQESGIKRLRKFKKENNDQGRLSPSVTRSLLTIFTIYDVFYFDDLDIQTKNPCLFGFRLTGQTFYDIITDN